LGLATFYSIIGPEALAWHVPIGTPAPWTDGRVHSDMAKGFIRAEVMRFANLDRLGSPARVKEADLLKVQGRDYLVADRDILLFRFQRRVPNRSICF
jgi:ribosome-binding ATPase